MCEAGRVFHRGQAARGELASQLATHSARRIRVGEEDRSERDRGRAGGEKLEGVASSGDAAHAHDRHPGRSVALVDGRQGDRLQAGPGVAAGLAAELRLERPVVEGEPAHGVHEGEPVGAGGLDGAGRVRKVGRGRRKLGVERLSGFAAGGVDDLRGTLRRLLDVRAGEVELDRGHLRPVVERGAELRIVARREAADRDPERDPELRELRQLVGEERLDSRGSRARSSSASRLRSRRSVRDGFPRGAAV